MPDLRSRFRGCLLGGAVGDALGGEVEFWTHAQIVRQHGERGPADLGTMGGVAGAITDDTQMTLWTADGLLRADHRWATRGICHPPGVVYRSYLRWLATQDGEGATDVPLDGWLVEHRALWAKRAPGATCLSALRSGRMGAPGSPINESKGCGGVMRAAPVGLLADREQAFGLACETAAITHGHATGQVAAGALAVAVGALLDGASLADALDHAERRAADAPRGHETADALAHARGLAASDLDAAAAVHQLGGVTPNGPGWVAEEALAVAAFCARRHPTDPEQALRAAVTHTGDSDSTGALCGNLVGAALGEEALPARWAEAVELADVVLQVADDLHDAATGGTGWYDRYPPA